MHNTLPCVDFHCHLDLYPDFPALVAETDRAGILTLAVTTTPQAWPRNNELAAQTQHVRAALGLHPQLVAERARELPIFEQYLPNARFIGEVGLDAGPQFYRSFELQKQVFVRILELCALEGEKVVSVHSVRSAGVVLEMVETHLPPARGTVILHWFSGSQSEARRALGLGCFFSINMEMLQSDRQRGMIAAIPDDRLLTETDGPFTQVNGRPSRPSDICALLQTLANVRGTEVELLASTVRANAERLWQ
jgi:TatD DNase family protein